MPSDVELMQAIVRGQAKAFDVFFSRYRDAVRAHAAGMLRDEVKILKNACEIMKFTLIYKVKI